MLTRPVDVVAFTFSISVVPQVATEPWSNLASCLQEFFPVRFVVSDEAAPDCCGRLEMKDCGRSSDRGGGPILTLPGSVAAEGELTFRECSIQFGNLSEVPFPFRGRAVRCKIPAHASALRPEPGETVLASAEGGPVWVISTQSSGTHYRSAFPVPPIPANGGFQDLLHADRFMELLPILHWLREITAKTAVEPPPLRASFVVDDPNLHWPTYGYVDYSEVAKRATRANYHVTFATIPLDAWFTHRPTAEIFQRNPDRLSLCVHGNNHLRAELAQEYTPSGRLALLNQAQGRVQRLEKKSRLSVCRIMIPPHGACSEAMLADLGSTQFDGACISHGSLRAHNRGKSWTGKLGYHPTEWIRGCPVMPRWGLAGSIKNTILLAAYLHQPLILRGHQKDFENGVEILDDTAQFINSLGRVFWGSLADLAAVNYASRLEGTSLTIRPFSRRINVSPPPQATEVLLELPCGKAPAEWVVSYDLTSEVGRISAGAPLSLAFPNHALKLRSISAPDSVLLGADRAYPGVWPMVRRLLTEGRDRFLSRIAGRKPWMWLSRTETTKAKVLESRSERSFLNAAKEAPSGPKNSVC